MYDTRISTTAMRQQGFSLMELMIVIALMMLLASFAIPAYSGYIEDARASQAVNDIGRISLEVQRFQTNNNGALPATLDEIGLNNLRDPWGKRYIYVPFDDATPKGQKRRSAAGNTPINTDFDVLSRGEDGKSARRFNKANAKDDIVRAYNGTFVGLAEEL